MKSNTEVLKIAKKYIGQGGARFRKFCGLPSGSAWCNAFVDYIAHEGGVSVLYFDGKKETYCPHSIRWCKKNLAEIPPYLAMPMDIIYFDWEKNGIPNHIGFVRDKKSTTQVRTIEGNTSGGVVAEKVRTSQYIQAIYRPHYEPKSVHLGAIKVDGIMGYETIANLQQALSEKPNGILSKGTITSLQSKFGAYRDGIFGANTAKSIQKAVGVKVDGAFGVESVKALQRWINRENGHENEGKKPYPKKLPKLPPKTAKIAVECAYPYKTPLKKYKYSGGKPKPEYKERLNKAWAHRSHWKYAKSRAGASCDVFAGVVLKNSGYKNSPHAMSKFVKWCRNNLKKSSSLQNGDILTRTNHIMIYLDLKGKRRVANAHFLDHGGTYGIIENPSQYTNIWRVDCPSYFSKGDQFTDVRKLKRYLNWYGGYDLDDNYNFDNLTEYAVKDFQVQEGLKPTGRFGVEELKKARVVRK